MSEARKPTHEEFAAMARAIVWIQNACQHKNVDQWSFVLEGQRGWMRQCRDCAMYNPPNFTCASANSP
jgi:hypothetical protein